MELRPSTSGTETLLSAFPQPRNAKPMEGKTESEKCCLNGRSWGIATIHSCVIPRNEAMHPRVASLAPMGNSPSGNPFSAAQGTDCHAGVHTGSQ